MKKILLSIAIASTLMGCASSPQNAEQVVFATQASYTGAVIIAGQYKALPICNTSGPVICKDPAMVKKLQDADDLAAPTLQAAQNIVRQPAAGLNVDTAVNLAKQALAILTNITSTLKVK